MNCSGCEARREWIKKQSEKVRERFALLLGRITADDDKSNAANDRADKTK